MDRELMKGIVIIMNDTRFWRELFYEEWNRRAVRETERDEARKLATQYYGEIKKLKRENEYGVAEYRALELEYAKLKRLYEQAVCEHGVGGVISYVARPGMMVADKLTCANCGKVLQVNCR